jgi:hypothetical protein
MVAWQTLTGIDEHGANPKPASTTLQLSPNPFSGIVRISCRSSGARTVIRDREGRTVRELSRPGSGPAYWDGRDCQGQQSPNGIYFVEAGIGSQAARQKLVLLR